MITGTVNDDGVPIIALSIASQTWTAIVDTGFNGDLELPEALRTHFDPRFVGRVVSLLAADQEVEESAYFVDFWFDGEVHECQTTFSKSDEILLGTGLLQEHELRIDFPSRSVEIAKPN